MFSKTMSTLLILANLSVTTEVGLIDGVIFCSHQLATLFEWFLLTVFLAAFVTALCGTNKECKVESSKEKAENVTEDAKTLDLDLSKVKFDNENIGNVQDLNGNKIRKRPASLRDIWDEEEGGPDLSENFLDCITNEEDKDPNVDDEVNNPISTEATFTDAIAESLVRDLLENSDNDDIEQMLEGKNKRIGPDGFSGFWRHLPGKGDTKKVRNIWNLEDEATLKDQDATTVADIGDWQKKDSLQPPKEYWLSHSFQELAKTWTLEKFMDENSSAGATSTIDDPTKYEGGVREDNQSADSSNWDTSKTTGLRFQLSEGCVLNNPWLNDPYMIQTMPTLSDTSNLSIQRPVGLDFQIQDSQMMGSFSPPCCPGLGSPLADPFNSNVSNRLSENLGLLGIWVGSEDNFLQIRVPLVEEFANKD